MRRPKGILIPIGGHEDKDGHKAILTRVLDETRRQNPIVEVITIANDSHERISKDYFAAFRDLEVDKVAEIFIDDRELAFDKKIIRRIERCDAVFFSGGNQLHLTTLLSETDILKILKDKYYHVKDFVIAGTSAGAAAMSSTMILSGSSQDALIKGELELSTGLSFIENIFIDTHFVERGRFGRLIQTVASNPKVLGIGLSEDTGVVIYGGSEMEVIGSGLVVIADGTRINYTDLAEIRDGDPITVEGITMHVLAKGKRFSLEYRRLVR